MAELTTELSDCFGDYLLWGDPRYTMPKDWRLGRIVSGHDHHVVVEYTPAGGSQDLMVVNHHMVRAVGSIDELREIRALAAALVELHWKRHRLLTEQLSRTYATAWRQLDRITDGAPLTARHLPSALSDEERLIREPEAS